MLLIAGVVPSSDASLVRLGYCGGDLHNHTSLNFPCAQTQILSSRLIAEAATERSGEGVHLRQQLWFGIIEQIGCLELRESLY
jgi:hypothetical protein